MIDAARCLWRREGDCVMVIKVMWHDNDNDDDDDDDDDDMFICIYFIQSGMAQWLDDP